MLTQRRSCVCAGSPISLRATPSCPRSSPTSTPATRRPSCPSPRLAQHRGTGSYPLPAAHPKLSRKLTFQFQNRKYQLIGQGQGKRMRSACIPVCEACDSTLTLRCPRQSLLLPNPLRRRASPTVGRRGKPACACRTGEAGTSAQSRLETRTRPSLATPPPDKADRLTYLNHSKGASLLCSKEDISEFGLTWEDAGHPGVRQSREAAHYPSQQSGGDLHHRKRPWEPPEEGKCFHCTSAGNFCYRR